MSVTILPSADGAKVDIQVGGVTRATIDSAGNITVTGQAKSAAPAFRANRSTDQSLSEGTWTKVQLPNEDFDTASCFDSTTNHRFLPTAPGYYLLNWVVAGAGVTNTNRVMSAAYKNGSAYQYGSAEYLPSATGSAQHSVGSALVYLNGTTDYVELWAYINGAGGNNANAGTAFAGVLVKAT
jgi:hypothetical protein